MTRALPSFPLSTTRRRRHDGRAYAADEFGEPLSDFRADGLIDFFIRALGPPLYSQGVRDAVAYMQARLTDIDGEVFEPDAPE